MTSYTGNPFTERDPLLADLDANRRFRRSKSDTDYDTEYAYKPNALGYQKPTPSKKTEGDKINTIIVKVEEATDVARDNIDKVIDRNNKIDDLIDKTSDLEQGATRFLGKSRKLKKQMWWDNCKKNTLCITITSVIIAILIVIIVVSTAHKK